MHTVIQPLAVLAQGLLLCAERGVAPAPPPPAGPGVMGDAYAQARARAGEQLRDGRQEAQALGQRQVSIPGRPASDPTAKGAAPAQSRSSPESKSQAGKRKREQEEAGSAAGAGGMVDQAPPCVTANVWKAAKVAAARLDEETGRQEEEKATQTLILDAALKCGMGGRAVGTNFLMAYPDLPVTRLTSAGEGLLAERLAPLLESSACSERQLADALDLVRRFPSQARAGGTWPVGDMVAALLPSTVRMSAAAHAKLAAALTLLVQSNQGAAGAQEGEKEGVFAKLLARSGVYGDEVLEEIHLREWVGAGLRGHVQTGILQSLFARLFAEHQAAAARR